MRLHVIEPSARYLKLGLQDFEEPQGTFIARSALGLNLNLPSSRGVAVVGDAQIQCSVYTSPLLLRPLLGRELLNRLKVTLDGPRNELAVQE